VDCGCGEGLGGLKLFGSQMNLMIYGWGGGRKKKEKLAKAVRNTVMPRDQRLGHQLTPRIPFIAFSKSYRIQGQKYNQYPTDNDIYAMLCNDVISPLAEITFSCSNCLSLVKYNS
jgi:hypothetical protein